MDLETKPGPQAWQLAILEPGREPRRLSGTRTVEPARLPGAAPDAAERDGGPRPRDRASRGVRGRAPAYALPDDHARAPLARTLRPAGGRPGAGHRVRRRRIINGQPRAPHSGIDFAARAAPRWSPSTAAASRCSGDFFFPGRLVVARSRPRALHALFPPRHGGGDRRRAGRARAAARHGGRHGRATGPHLHFGAQVGAARVDPAALSGLDVRD